MRPSGRGRITQDPFQQGSHCTCTPVPREGLILHLRGGGDAPLTPRPVEHEVAEW